MKNIEVADRGLEYQPPTCEGGQDSAAINGRLPNGPRALRSNNTDEGRWMTAFPSGIASCRRPDRQSSPCSFTVREQRLQVKTATIAVKSKWHRSSGTGASGEES